MLGYVCRTLDENPRVTGVAEAIQAARARLRGSKVPEAGRAQGAIDPLRTK